MTWLRIDDYSHKVFIDDVEVHTSKQGFRLLKCFSEFPGRMMSREFLLNEVWGVGVNVSDRTVDSAVFELRKLLGKYRKSIVTIRGEGFRFDP